jgi:hypothetical protein
MQLHVVVALSILALLILNCVSGVEAIPRTKLNRFTKPHPRLDNQIKPAANYCAGCIVVVKMVESYGCVLVCDTLPFPINYICDWFLGSICKEVLQWILRGETPERICTQIGFCNAGQCSCGVCTKYTTNRCLGWPHKCPSSLKLPERPHDLKDALPCLAGKCTNQTVGCCLTCF